MPSLEIIDRHCDRYEWARSEITGSLLPWEGKMIDQANCDSKDKEGGFDQGLSVSLFIITLCNEYIALRISTAHDFCVIISARAHARVHVQNVRGLPQEKLERNWFIH